ncbi:MAG: hypothetical protein C0506_15000 [Anaerolinea sp.]|nr:hypothetical protein [Anaerolinea sp.]
MRNFFDPRPGYDAAVFAEAQALADDGLDREFVLGLFPDDAEWLDGLLAFSGGLKDAISADPPSYYFEASLKSRFLAAGREAARAPEPQPVFPFARMRTVAASMSVALSAAVVSVITLGFVTAGSAVPGDWNYSFKLANERIEYTLSRGDSRVDVQFRLAEARVQEIRVLSSRGDVSASDLASLEREARALGDLARTQQFDDEQLERLKGIANRSAVVLNETRQKQPGLEPEVAAAAAAVNSVATTALATPPPATPSATVTPTQTPDATTTPPASVTPTPATAGTPATTPQATPAASATANQVVTPPETPTATPSPGQATPAASATPTP